MCFQTYILLVSWSINIPYISRGPKNGTILSWLQFQNRPEEFGNISHRIFSACFQSNCEFSKQVDSKRRNESCLKIACQKTQNRRYQQYGTCMKCALHDIPL